MLRNYFVNTFRLLIRQKGFTMINIAGLSIGMAIAILISLWVRHELSYDAFNSKSDRLFRLVQTQHYASGPLTTTCMPGPIARDIREEIPEIVNSFTYFSLSLTVQHAEKMFTEEVRLADKELFQMFDFEFITGNPVHIFNDLNEVVVTDKMAGKLFGTENPIGRIIVLNNTMEFRVTGVIKEIPRNSSFRFDLCIPFKAIEQMGFPIDRYGWNSYFVYTELAPNSDYLDVNRKIRKYLEEKSRKQNTADGGQEYDSNIDLFLYPLNKIHLYSYRADERGGIQFVYFFSAIAVFIIVIACINFMNMATARASKRAKEISIRKSIGADRQDLIRQFLGESIILSFLAMIIAIVLVLVLVPYFNILVEKELHFPFGDARFWIPLTGITLLIGILAGSYPALYLSAFDPVKIYRQGLNKGRGNYYFRRALVIFQFALSAGLIISTMVVQRQLDFIYTSNLGMVLKDVVMLTLRAEGVEKYEVLKQELLRNPNFLAVSRAGDIPFNIGSNSGGIEWEGKETEDDIIVGFAFADEGYSNTLGMQMAEGRFFSAEIQSDTQAVVINETATRAFGMKDPVGKWLTWGDNNKFRIIGVIKDFHHLPMQHGIDPLSLYYAPDRCDQMFVKTNPGNPDGLMEDLRKVWEANVQGFPFEPRYLETIYNKSYSDEARLIKIIRYFAMLAILISCLGLFALSTYMAEQRTKEIGIRKVMGARTSTIVAMLSREFIIWVLVANLIAWPVSWFALEDWLSSYAFHTRLSPGIFVLTLLLSLAIALITVTYQSISVAMKKPVNAIKYE